MTTALQATGEIKWFQIGICVIMLSELPIGYILLSYGYPPYYALCPDILTGIIAIFFRIFLLKRYIPECNISHYLFAVFARSMAIGIVTWIICNYIHSFFPDTFFTVILTSLISVVILFNICFFLFGLSSVERSMIRQKLELVIHRMYE